VFLNLTKKQTKALGIKTNIQRGDSVLLESGIRSYSRLALLVEVLRRLYSILNEQDQATYHVLFQAYQIGGEHFVYNVASDERKIELNNLAIAYYTAYNGLQESYGQHPIFQLFERVYQEHFKREEAETISIVLRPKEELGSDTLQSPDDLEATFRTKRKETHQGFVALGIETCHPDNEVNLITTLGVDHLDGGFGSEDIDTKAKKEKIKIIQTAVKGRTAKVKISVTGNEKNGFMVACPNPEHPTIQANKTNKHYKATFELGICNGCPFRFNCPAYKQISKLKQTAKA